MLLRLVFPATKSRSIFLVSGVYRLVCVQPDQLQQFRACIFTILDRFNFEDTLRMYQCNLFTSGGQHKIFLLISFIDLVPESSSSFQYLSYSTRISGTGPANLVNRIQLVVLFELLTKCLQNRFYHCWWVRVQQRGLHLWVHPISLPHFLCMLFKVALQGHFGSPSVCEETLCLYVHSESILIASSKCSICTAVLVRSTCLVLL